MSDASTTTRLPTPLPKCPTGIDGLDEITHGGLPQGRPTLVCGSAGCGKTLFAIEFLVRGATQFGEPGVFMAFEETTEELAQNVASLGFDLDALAAERKLLIDHVRVERSEIEETGEYDLEGLFIRLGYAIDCIGARRVVLDTIETLFSGLDNAVVLRAELRRLFRWLKEKGVTAVITGERGGATLTRQGLEEYVSDCVILLDHRVSDQVSTRRLRIVKYRGSTHGTNEYPFLIHEDGISVLPITSLRLSHTASTERVSSGVPRLDAMLGAKGYYRGSSILVSGTAGTGKSSLASAFVDAACRRGERALYFAFEESPDQIIRNMRSIGIDLEPSTKQGLLQFVAARPSIYGLEMHLAMFHKYIVDLKPQVVVLDPVSNLIATGSSEEVTSTLTRMVDHLKTERITALFTHLTDGPDDFPATEAGISSIMDTWLLLRDVQTGGEHNRTIMIFKSRGMAHSNQIREFLLTDSGIDILDVYTGPEGVLTGSARLVQEGRARAEMLRRQQDAAMRRAASERKRTSLQAQITALQAEIDAEEQMMQAAVLDDAERDRRAEEERTRMARLRKADAPTSGDIGEARRPESDARNRDDDGANRT